MAERGQEIGGGDLRLRLVRTAAETGGELLEMEARYAGSGGMPPEHLHPRQAETFTVLEGAMETVVGGVERRYEAGETFEVPAGTPHRMAADGPTRVTWQVRPALRTAEFFERLLGGGPAPGRVPDGLGLLEEFSDEVQLVTPPSGGTRQADRA